MKTAATHTTGPWEIMESGLIYAPPLPGSDASILVADVGEMTAEREANAFLIAAAPVMFEALCDVARYFDKWDNENLVERVNQAIARAKP